MQGYRPLVYAFNHALRALHKIDVLLRKSPKLSLLFHRNHPKPITATHNDHPSTRNPDIILVSLEAAQKAFSEGDPGTWDDHAESDLSTRHQVRGPACRGRVYRAFRGDDAKIIEHCSSFL